jgi:hypothetical protein
MTPTSVNPALSAFLASLTAVARPALCGTDASTIVHPFWPAGHTVSWFEGGGGGGGGSGVVGTDSVGSVDVDVSAGGGGDVAPVPVPSGTVA